MNANFLPCLAFVLKWEGGKDDDPADPGGRTFEGIEQREYNAWCKLRHLPGGDVWQCPQVTVTDIYRVSYWNPYCDALPVGLDLMFFDTAVNEGPAEAVIFLQAVLGVRPDGHFGVITGAAVKSITDVKTVVMQMSQARQAHYKALPLKNKRLKKFLRGWLNRDADCVEVAMKMVTGEAVTGTRSP
jgi:lysozyme family protein